MEKFKKLVSKIAVALLPNRFLHDRATTRLANMAMSMNRAERRKIGKEIGLKIPSTNIPYRK